MKLLDAVNVILPKLGERPVTALDEPNSSVDVILPVMEVHRQSLLSDGWWFQRQKIRINENQATRQYDLGKNVLAFYPENPSQAAFTPGMLVHPETQNPYDVVGPVDGWSVLDVEFDALPIQAQLYIMYTAGLQILEDSLDKQTMQAWYTGAVSAMDKLTTAEIRTTKPREMLAAQQARRIYGPHNVLEWTGANFRVV